MVHDDGYYDVEEALTILDRGGDPVMSKFLDDKFKALVGALQWVFSNWDNQDINHTEYRVNCCLKAQLALDIWAEKGASMFAGMKVVVSDKVEPGTVELKYSPSSWRVASEVNRDLHRKIGQLLEKAERYEKALQEICGRYAHVAAISSYDLCGIAQKALAPEQKAFQKGCIECDDGVIVTENGGLASCMDCSRAEFDQAIDQNNCPTCNPMGTNGNRIRHFLPGGCPNCGRKD